MKRHIPNALTSCNLLCGCIAASFAYNGMLRTALMLILLGAIFDFFDGMVARLLHVSSPIGKELDSLADVITFGFAPATMVFYQIGVVEYPEFLQPFRPYLPYAAYLIAVFSALRLAKFNIDSRQTTGFIGLPTPANALFWASFLLSCRQFVENGSGKVWLLLLMVAASCVLLVCELPMFALKFKSWAWKGNETKYSFAALSLLLLLLFGVQDAWWGIILLYIAVSAALCLFGSKKAA